MARAPRNVTFVLKTLSGVIRAVGKCGQKNAELTGPGTVAGAAPTVPNVVSEAGLLEIIVDGQRQEVPVTLERPVVYTLPPPVLVLTVTPNSGPGPLSVTFDASASTGVVVGATFALVYGDGASTAPQSLLSLGHNYVAGVATRTYTGTLTNPDGQFSVVTGSISITAAAPPPNPLLTATQTYRASGIATALLDTTLNNQPPATPAANDSISSPYLRVIRAGAGSIEQRVFLAPASGSWLTLAQAVANQKIAELGGGTLEAVTGLSLSLAYTGTDAPGLINAFAATGADLTTLAWGSQPTLPGTPISSATTQTVAALNGIGLFTVDITAMTQLANAAGTLILAPDPTVNSYGFDPAFFSAETATAANRPDLQVAFSYRATVGSPAPSPTPTPAPSPGYPNAVPFMRLGGNLGNMADYVHGIHNNLFSQSRGFATVGNAGDPLGGPAPLDALGNPTGPCETFIVNTDGRSEFPAGVYKGRHTGPGQPLLILSQNWAITNIANTAPGTVGNVCTYDCTNTALGNLAMRFDGATANHELLPSGVNRLTYKPMLDNYATFCAPLHSLRMMDWAETNLRGLVTDYGQITWADRKPDDSVGSPRKSWKQIVAAANQIYAEPGSRLKRVYFNVPPHADAAYVTQMATLVKTQLAPGLVAVFARSNEIWNTMFQVFHQYLLEGNNTAGPDYARISVGGAATDQYQRFANVWALRHARMAAAIKAVYGADFGVTGEVVLEGHAANPYWTKDLIDPFLRLPAQVTEFGLPETYTHEISCGFYLGGSYAQYDACTTVDQIIDGLRNTFDYSLNNAQTVAAWNAWKTHQMTGGYRALGCYEGMAPHLDGSGNIPLKMAAHRSAAMGALLQEAGERMRLLGFTYANYFSWEISKYRPGPTVDGPGAPPATENSAWAVAEPVNFRGVAYNAVPFSPKHAAALAICATAT